MRWATSDHHWGHWRLNTTYCQATRGFPTVEEMNAQLVARWNESIAPDDEVLLVGDAFCSRRMTLDEKVGILRMLHGRKTLVRGNHDDDLRPFTLAGFEAIVDHIWMPDERILVIHKGPDPRYAPAELAIRDRLDPALVVHGHDHRHDTPDAPGCLNVCVDRWGLRPVPWATIEAHLPRAHQITPDSHQQEEIGYHG